MAYEKQNFKDGDTLYASHMNHIEDGIEEIDSKMPTVTYDEYSVYIDSPNVLQCVGSLTIPAGHYYIVTAIANFSNSMPNTMIVSYRYSESPDYHYALASAKRTNYEEYFVPVTCSGYTENGIILDFFGAWDASAWNSVSVTAYTIPYKI